MNIWYSKSLSIKILLSLPLQNKQKSQKRGPLPWTGFNPQHSSGGEKYHKLYTLIFGLTKPGVGHQVSCSVTLYSHEIIWVQVSVSPTKHNNP